MSDTPVILFPNRANTVKEGLDTYLKNITQLIKDNKIETILTIFYEKDEAPTLYVAGDYSDREILGDLRIIEQSVLDGELQ